MAPQKHSRIAIVIGTRAELVKLFPLLKELDKRNIPYHLIHTGQHNISELCDSLGIKRPHSTLTKETKGNTKFKTRRLFAVFWNIGSLFRIRKSLKKLSELEYVIYHGDTMTTAAAAIASSRLMNLRKKYKNVHLEAGLRSFNLLEPFPEEFSRRLVGLFTEVYFVPSEKAEKNQRKKSKKKIILSGNTIIDATYEALLIAQKKSIKPLSKKKFAIITVHRHENLASKKRMEKIVDILLSIPITSYFPVHDNTLARLKKYGLYEKIKKSPHINLIQPLDYFNFIYQFSKSSLVVCDGGTMQEESLIFQKPCIILRKSTERPEGLKANYQYLSKLDVEPTKKKIKEYLSPTFKVTKHPNPYGKRGLTKKIVDELTKKDGKRKH